MFEGFKDKRVRTKYPDPSLDPPLFTGRIRSVDAGMTVIVTPDVPVRDSSSPVLFGRRYQYEQISIPAGRLALIPEARPDYVGEYLEELRVAQESEGHEQGFRLVHGNRGGRYGAGLPEELRFVGEWARFQWRKVTINRGHCEFSNSERFFD